MVWIADPEILEAEYARFDPPAATSLTWVRFAPVDLNADPDLSAFAAHLAKPETQAAVDAHEEARTYPQPVLDELWERGLAPLFAELGASDSRSTPYHLTALNVLASPSSASLAVTVGITSLSLITASIAADDEQLEAFCAAMREEHAGCVCLSEPNHGSNLLRIEAQATPGRLDAAGAFVAAEGDEPVTHYRLRGQKHMINGASQHGVIVVLVRTRVDDPDAPDSSLLAARGAHSVFWVRRNASTVGLGRWQTLPAQAADIAGIRFDDTLLPVANRLGGEGEGFGLVQKTLSASRGGISGFATGALSTARSMAWTYAARRNVYGRSIASLGGIAHHLMRVDALDRMCAATSLRSVAWMNGAGIKAGPYTAIAKLVCCRLAEEGADETRQVLGARAFLRELPFARLSRDVALFGVFDGTSHVMLDELTVRLTMRVRKWVAKKPQDPLADSRRVYATPPRPIRASLRGRGDLNPVCPVLYAQALAALPGSVDLGPLAELAVSVFELAHELSSSDAWRQDQTLRFGMADAYANLEGLLALVELFDPDRRAAVIDRPAPSDAFDRLGYAFAIGWLSSRVCSNLLSIQASAGLTETSPVSAPGGLTGLLGRLLAGHDALRREYAAAIATHLE